MSAPLRPRDTGFSLVIGGPLYRMLRRARLEGTDHELLGRRIGLAILITWAPLLLLSLFDGNAWSGKPVPFLHDVDANVRFLIVLPLLFVAEFFLHQRVGVAVQKFDERGLIPEPRRPQTDTVYATAARWLDSVWVEVLLLVLVYSVGVTLVWRHVSALQVETWYGGYVNGERVPTLAGWWLGLVSVPLLQFLLLRWYYRLLVWWRLMWQVSRMDLNLQPLHPDHCGGLGFLSQLCLAFAPFLFAEGAMVSGQIANQIFYAGATLPAFKIELAAITAVAVFVIVGPMMMYIPVLARARREGLGKYGTLATQYTRDFDRKWMSDGAQTGEPLIGSSDIQSLADLGNSYATLSEMRLVPFNMRTMVQLGIFVLLPVAPLLLTMISLEELLSQMVKVLF